jgi:hypothetical protein
MLMLQMYSPVLPLSSSLWFNSPPLPSFPVWIGILYTHIQCVRGGGGWSSESQTDKHLPQSPFTSQFFRWRHFVNFLDGNIFRWCLYS